MGFFDSLLSAGANLLGGSINRQNQNKINDLNIQNAARANATKIQTLVADANKAGINPLAALGVSGVSPAVAVGDDTMGKGVAAAGQDIGRAANALSSQETKEQQLRNRLLEAEIANKNADTVRQQAAASAMQVRHGQPGTVSVRGVPIPRESPFTKDTLPLFQDYRGRHGERVTLLSEEAARTQFGPGSAVGTGLPIGVGLAAENAGNMARDLGREHEASAVVPGAAWRSVINGYDPYSPF